MERIPHGIEERTRVVCALPFSNAPKNVSHISLIKAVAAILDYVEMQQRYGIGIDGYTTSNGGLFSGWWRSGIAKTINQWVNDDILMLILDFKLTTESGIWVKLWELRVEISEAYEKNGQPQEEVWIVSYPIFRQTGVH